MDIYVDAMPHESASKYRRGVFSTEESKNAAVAMRTDGCTLEDISRHFDCTRPTILKLFKKLGCVKGVGIVEPPPRRAAKPVIPPVHGLTEFWQVVAESEPHGRYDKWVYHEHTQASIDQARARGEIVTCLTRDTSTGRMVMMARVAK